MPWVMEGLSILLGAVGFAGLVVMVAPALWHPEDAR